MSLYDNLFVENAEEDVRHFLKSSEQRKRVLIFPPVNNYRRFLIHQLVQNHFGDILRTFSIGQGFDRRTVICYKSDFIGLPGQVNGVSVQGNNSIIRESLYTMGIESQCTPTASPEHGGAQRSRQVKSAPAAEIYVPPALRRNKTEKSPGRPTSVEPTSSTETPTKVNRQKRPDRAVYVPRHRRGAAEVDNSNATTAEPQSKPSREQPRVSKRPIERVPLVRRTHETVSAPVAENCESEVKAVEKMESEIMPVQKVQQEVTSVQENNSIIQETKVLVPESVIYKEESKLALENNDSLLETVEDQIIMNDTSVNVIQDEMLKVETKQDFTHVEMLDHKAKNETIVEKEITETIPPTEDVDISNQREFMNSDVQTNVSISTVLECDKTENIIKPESGIMNSKIESSNNSANNKNVLKPLVSKVLIISTSDIDDKPQQFNKEEEEKSISLPISPPEKKVKKVERPKSKPAPPPTPSIKINRDECDWDSLFDDNGDCLDPTLIEELTSSVGEVVIEKPKSSYKPFSRPVEVSSDEFAHVLEIYNFPSEFKTSDLATVFSPFKTEGFELKWVDDTHCLAVFSSPLVAAEVLASDHPFVKTRPLSEATTLSKTKARRSSEFLQPFRTRPETCAALARRLVTKSLGVKLATAKQEREQEKIVLREAKEKKRLANKQREEIWEGIIAPKTTS